MIGTEWIYCPVCGNKTRVRIREDRIANYNLWNKKKIEPNAN